MRRWILFALVAVLGADASNMSAQVVARRPGSPSVERAWLGISYESVRGRPGDARATLVILEVVDGSPAQRAGIQVGDTLVNINGLRASDELLQSLASSLSVGDTVKIRMRRGGRDRDLEVVAASRPAESRYYVYSGFDNDSLRTKMRIIFDSALVNIDSAFNKRIIMGVGPGGMREFKFHLDSMPQFFKMRDSLFMQFDTLNKGMFFRFGTDSLRAEFDSLRMRLMLPRRGGTISFTGPDGRFFVADTLIGAPFGIMRMGQTAIAGAEVTQLDPGFSEPLGVSSGVLVVRVPRETPAARAGLQAADVIVRANGTAVETVDALRRAIMRTPRGQTTKLEVMRKKSLTTVELGRD